MPPLKRGGGYYCFIFIPLNQYYNKKALFNWSVKGIMIQTSPYLVREGWGGGKKGCNPSPFDVKTIKRKSNETQCVCKELGKRKVKK